MKEPPFRSVALRLAPALCAVLAAGALTAWAQPSSDPTQQLRAELSDKGWLLFTAKTEKQDYDLFLCRPDGSQKRNLTQTGAFHEFGGRFSPDSKRILYRRLPKPEQPPKGEVINHDLWGAAGALFIAKSDGTEPSPYGKEGDYPWASWSTDGSQIACLYKREGKIRIHQVIDGKVVREMPRQGIFQQMFWSGDGKRVCGTANLNGRDWNIVSLDLESGKPIQVSRNLACTPDWFQGDPNTIIYSSRTPGIDTDYGWTMLMQGTADGSIRKLLYAERGKHIYYGCTSPDDKYALFSVPESDGGTDADMAIMRIADAPIILPDDYMGLKELHPGAKAGPVLRLTQPGFEPHWTYAHLEGK